MERITIKNIIGTKSLEFKADKPYFKWASDAEYSDAAYRTDYSISRGAFQIQDEPIPTSAENPSGLLVSLVNGRMYLLPQTITNASSLEFVYSWNYRSGLQEIKVAQFAEEVVLPETLWQPSVTINYHLTIHLNGTSEIEVVKDESGWIVDWENPNAVPPSIDLI